MLVTAAVFQSTIGPYVVVAVTGSVSHADAAVQPGDEIMVLPKIETKSIETTRGITQIVYQIAIAAKVLFGL